MDFVIECPGDFGVRNFFSYVDVFLMIYIDFLWFLAYINWGYRVIYKLGFFG